MRVPLRHCAHASHPSRLFIHPQLLPPSLGCSFVLRFARFRFMSHCSRLLTSRCPLDIFIPLISSAPHQTIEEGHVNTLECPVFPSGSQSGILSML